MLRCHLSFPSRIKTNGSLPRDGSSSSPATTPTATPRRTHAASPVIITAPEAELKGVFDFERTGEECFRA